MITLHHLENSRSQRIAWLLEELGLDYTVVRYARQPPMMLAPKALREVHPLGKSPVITEDGMALSESGAIIEYVIEQHGGGRLRPAEGTPERRAYVFWMHFAEGSMMPLLVMTLVFGRLGKKPIPFFLRPVGKMFSSAVQKNYIGPSLKAQLQYMDDTLDGQAYLCGDDFTAADIQMSFPLQGARSRLDLSPYPHIRSWLDRIEARDGWHTAVERVGPLTPL